MDIALQRELARLLATLRREGRQQSGLDRRLVPSDNATAYRVAASSRKNWAGKSSAGRSPP